MRSDSVVKPRMSLNSTVISRFSPRLRRSGFDQGDLHHVVAQVAREGAAHLELLAVDREVAQEDHARTTVSRMSSSGITVATLTPRLN